MGLGLIGAGILSGMGAGASKGMDEALRVNLYRDLEKSRQEHEDMRQTRALEAQKMFQERGFGHAEKMQKEGFTQTLKVHELDNELRSLLEDKRYNHDTESQSRVQMLQRELESARLAQAKELAENSIKSHETISAEERTLRRDLAKLTIDAQKDHATLVPREDGTLARISQDGKITTVVDPATGKPFKGIHDLPASTKAMGEIISTMIKGNDYLMKNPLLTDDQRKVLKDENTNLFKNMQTLFGMEGKFQTEPGLTMPTAAQQREFLEKNAERLKTPQDLQDAVDTLRKKGIDPGFLMNRTTSEAPAADASPPPVASPAPAAPSTGFAQKTPGPTRSGGLIYTPPPSASQQSAMAAAVAGMDQPSPTMDLASAPAPTPVPAATPTPAEAIPEDVVQSGAPEGPPSPGLVGAPAPTASEFVPEAPKRVLQPTDIMELLTKDERLAIVNMVKRIQSPGVKEKPATRDDLRDLLIKTLGPWYAKNNQPPKELVADIKEMMKYLLPSQKDMSGNNYKYDVQTPG